MPLIVNVSFLIEPMTLAGVAQIAQNASLILASLFAIYGIDSWGREHIGKRRIELAEDVLALFYQARDAIESIRSPFGFGGEGSSRKPGPNERPEHKEALDQAYVLIERYSRHTELFARIHSLRDRVMAQLGSEAAAPFDSLNRIINALILSALSNSRMERTLPRWASRARLHEKLDLSDNLSIRLAHVVIDSDRDDPRSDGAKCTYRERQH